VLACVTLQTKGGVLLLWEQYNLWLSW